MFDSTVPPAAQTIVKKAAVLMDGNSFVRSNRLYYAYLRKTASSAAADLSEMEHTFGRTAAVTRLGQFIMDVKVCLF